MPISLEDRFAISELISLHGHLMDDGAFDRLDELFTDDVVYDVSAFGVGSLTGTAAIRDAGLALGSANPVGHHVTNVILTDRGADTVQVRSKWIGIMADGTSGSGVYEDTVRRCPQGWRISHRIVRPRRIPLQP